MGQTWPSTFQPSKEFFNKKAYDETVLPLKFTNSAVDEIQNCRNHRSQAFAAALALRVRSSVFVGSTATPVHGQIKVAGLMISYSCRGD